MKERKIGRCILVCFLIMLSVLEVSTSKIWAKASRDYNKKVIGIVFDNSSSMIRDDTTRVPIKAWCRATYALEVFASMLNEDDELYVYPMNTMEVEKDGKKSTYDKNKPLKIKGGSDVSYLETIKTPNVESAMTPISSLKNAGEDLKKEAGSSDEKWLIILTDGGNFCSDDAGVNWLDGKSKKAVEDILNTFSDSMNVMYLGIGDGISADLKDSERFETYSAKANSSEEITEKLTKMSNIIFGRDELETQNGSFETKITMNKIIVFAQGEGTDESSNLIEGLKPDNKISLKYSTSHDEPDTELKGVIETYTNVPIGQYKLPNDLSAAVYYEPDVDLQGVVLDENGNDVTENVKNGDGLPAGEYSFEFSLIDNGTGEEADQDQIGNISYETTYVLNGETKSASGEGNSIAIDESLDSGDMLQVSSVTAHYLSGYSLTKSGEDLNMSNVSMKDNIETMELTVPDEAFEVYVSEVNGYAFMMESFSDSKYMIPMTEEEMKRQTLEMNLEGGNIYADYEVDGNNYIITLKTDAKTKDIITGSYTMTLQTTFEKTDGTKVKSNEAIVKIEVLPEPHSIDVNVNVPQIQNYYQMSEIENAEPITISLTKDGNPLTDEELKNIKIISDESEVPGEGQDQITLLVDTDGLENDINIAPGESAVNITLKKTNDGPKTGDYTISAKAYYLDNNGIETTGEDNQKITIGNGPWWLKWLFIALIIIAILILLWLFMNMKVLPKHIDVETSNYLIEGEKTAGSPDCRYSKNGKKGLIRIQSPNNYNYPLCKCYIDIQIEADSPRRVPSKKRRVKVTSVPNCGGYAGLQEVKVGTSRFQVEYNDDDQPVGLFMKGYKSNTPSPKDYGILQSGSDFRIIKEVMDDDGGVVDVEFKGRLIFK